MTIDEEREALLPRTASDQRELAAAIDDLRAASASLAKRAVISIAAGLVLLIVTKIAARRLHG